MGGRGEGTSDSLVICESEPKFRPFAAETDDVSQGGGRVIGLGFEASLYRLFPGRLREDRFHEGGVADFLKGGSMWWCLALLQYCLYFMKCMRSPGPVPKSILAKWVHRIFAILSDIL